VQIIAMLAFAYDDSILLMAFINMSHEAYEVANVAAKPPSTRAGNDDSKTNNEDKKFENIAQTIFNRALSKLQSLDPTFSFGGSKMRSQDPTETVDDDAITAAITEFNTDVNADSNGNPYTEVDVDANTNANANANANDDILPEPLLNHMTLPPILSSSFEETNEDENNDNDVNAPQTNNQGVQQIKLMTPKKYVFENTDNDPNPLNKLPSIPLVQPMINASSNPVSFQSMASSLNSHRKSLSTATTLPIIMQHAHKGSMPLYFVPTKLSELQQKEKEFKKNEKRIKKQQKKLQKEMLQELKQTQQYKKI